MRAVLPVDVLDVDQAQIGFVDQFSRLDAVVRALAVQAPAGDVSQLVVDERHQRVQSRLVSLAPSSEEHRHLAGRGQNS
jgi:alpha-D-ribose 1-methylphosphonate 5-triphosphate synthase subunit PhnL